MDLWIDAIGKQGEVLIVDLDIATDAEKSGLVEWKKYRVRVNRIDPSIAPDINWPE